MTDDRVDACRMQYLVDTTTSAEEPDDPEWKRFSANVTLTDMTDDPMPDTTADGKPLDRLLDQIRRRNLAHRAFIEGYSARIEDENSGVEFASRSEFDDRLRHHFDVFWSEYDD